MKPDTSPDENASSTQAPPETDTRTRVLRGERRWTRWLVRLLSTGGVLLVLALLVVSATVRSASGTAWLLKQVPGLQVQAVTGPLWGDFAAQGLRYRLNAQQTLALDWLRWQGFALQRPTDAAWWERWTLHLDSLELGQLAVRGTSSDDTAPSLPTRLELPIGLDITALRIEQIQLDALKDKPLQALSAQVHLTPGLGDTVQHRLDALQLQWDRLQVTGSATLGAAAPLPLQAQLQLQPLQPANTPPPDGLAQDWQAQLQATGPLARLQLQARVSARGQSLQARAEVQPVAPQPLSALQAQLQALDLAPFMSGLPRTALTGKIDATLSPSPSATAQGLTLSLDLRNSIPGPLQDQQLPVSHLLVQARSDLQHPDQGELQQWQLQLHDGQRPAGRWLSQGRWQRDAQARWDIRLDNTFQGLQPALLDARAPAVSLDGPVQVHWRQSDDARDWLAEVQTQLLGRFDTAAAKARSTVPPLPLLPPLQLQLKAQASPQQLHIEQLQARSGTAQLSLTGRATPAAKATHNGTAPWRLKLDSTFTRFDPSVWWPGSDAAWQRGPHRLDGELHTELQAPLPGGSPAAATPAQSLRQLAGQLQLQLAPSVLMGVPLAGQVQLDSQALPAVTSSTPWLQALPALTLNLNTTLGENSGNAQATSLQLQGQWAAQPERDHWQLRLDSPALERLSPWLARWLPPTALSSTSPNPASNPSTATATALAGDLQVQLKLDGRWPQVRSSGQWRSRAIRWQGLSAEQGQLDWQLSNTAQNPLQNPFQLQGRIEQLRQQGTLLGPLNLSATGTAAAHQLTVQTDLSLPRALRTALAVQGGLSLGSGPQPGWRWQGQLQPGELRERGPLPTIPATAGASAAATTATPTRANTHPNPASLPLLQWSAMPITVSQSAGDGAELQAELGRTRLTAADAHLTLAGLSWRQGRGGPQLHVEAQLEPWRAAPLLQRLQPEFGWGGDLTLSGRLQFHGSPERVQADVRLQRDSGDLSVEDTELGTAPRRLGLADLRLALQADNGVWQLSQNISGGDLGHLQGRQTIRTSASALWPQPQDALSGQLDLQIEQLGHWGRWLPAGWRLSGRLATQARLGGRVEAPTFSGELSGEQIAVRNVLQGVDWRDAQLKVALAGDTMRIEQLQVRAGQGSLKGQGQGRLTKDGSLELTLQADHFAALQRVDRKLVLSGQAKLTQDSARHLIQGQLQADEGRFDFSQSDAPSLSDDVDVVRQRSAEGSDTNPSAANNRNPGRALALDLRLDLGPSLWLVGRGLNTRLTGELRASSPNNRLALNGNIRAVDGTYAAYGQKLQVERSVISFNGVPDNPRLDIEAIRPGLEDSNVRVGVTVTGTAQNPRIRLFSEPTMNDTERLSWLLMGRSTDGLGRTDLALLSRAAQALISGESASPSLPERLGLDQLSVRQNGEGDSAQTIVTIGKQLTQRWYVGYERSLNATSGTWQLIYRAAQRFTLRAQSGAENALDLIWTWKWGGSNTGSTSSATRP